MKIIPLICCFLVLQPLLRAVDISVGSTQISIPTPAGFSPVTKEMAKYAEFAARFVPATNKQFVVFLPEEDAVKAAKGEIPQSERKFYVQTTNELITPFVSASDFAGFKRVVKTQNEELVRKAQQQMPGILQKINKGISDHYVVDLGLSLNSMMALPPHYENERALAYSMLLKMGVNDTAGRPTIFEGVVTATFVHVRGKVLMLSVNAEKSGLDWSRKESQHWADAVIAANPSGALVAAHEATGIDWGQVGEKAMIGGIIGGLVALVALVFKKKKG